MDNELVWIETKDASGSSRLDRVPRSQVPAGFQLVTIMGHGPCWVDPASVKLGTEYRHGPFPAALRPVMARFAAVLSKVQPQSAEQWEDGFRFDMHAWTEIAFYERIADGMERFASHITGDDELSNQKRKEIFIFMMRCAERGPIPDGARAKPVGMITENRANEIWRWMFCDEVIALLSARSNAHRELIQPGELIGPARVSLSALVNEEVDGFNKAAQFLPRELIASADVVLGVDNDTGDEFLVFGREHQWIENSNTDPPGVRVLRVELDANTQELETLVALISAVKGRHDFKPDAGDE